MRDPFGWPRRPFPARRGGFSPASLFANGEPGVWYGPSDLTTLFRDTTGTTPVTAAGQSVGLMLDKSKGLALGPELVTNGGFDSGSAGWLANSVAVVGWDAGRLSVQRVSSAADVAYQVIATVVGKTYRFSFDAAGEQSAARVAVSTGPALLSPLAVMSAPGGVFTATTTTSFIGFGAAGNGRTAFYDNISVRELLGDHATQATAAARPTYQASGTGAGYLYDDLVDDAINWTAPAGNYTVAWVDTAGTVTTQTAQALSGATDVMKAQNMVGYVAIGRALTAAETASLTAWFKAKAGV